LTQNQFKVTWRPKRGKGPAACCQGRAGKNLRFFKKVFRFLGFLGLLGFLGF